MKTVLRLSVFLLILLPGCVFIQLPGIQPLTEKVVGGKGSDKVLLIEISGVISDEGDRTRLIGLTTAPNITARVKEELTKASEDGSVKAVVLRINTPGGSVTTCDIISHEIKSFRKKRNVPVIAELMDVAASGGYYIAASADEIVAHPTTITGSIGVIAYGVNASGLMEKIGIENQTIKSGDKKDIGTPLRRMTDEERRILSSVIDAMYERFLDSVMETRSGKIDRNALQKAADGRIYTARQALDLKLIDRVGYLDDAVALAREKAGIEEATIVTYAQPSTYKNNIYSALAPAQPPAVSIVNIDAGTLGMPGLRFMYLWMP